MNLGITNTGSVLHRIRIKLILDTTVTIPNKGIKILLIYLYGK